ncbi:RimJ/RimL family protein N-acetyltransferase [Krasilnikovia cinnamomea]|uniref:RimJ/RimL family protein N-acetyltransferase n=1 Tax=Krasilnikovia cinnamomea TaxID=349313 RepID=A0A4Q7ZFX6_9ACTN|nr:GNAT family N-acetyltransferase [Krasilnikovia cinnamomea]RZU49254.1 RimJ/RimL family protein N-acetyltransferase [Krasilnikovia cinnamomea]
MPERDVASNEALWTTRLSLRRPSRTDIEAIYRIHSDRRACAHNPSDMLADPADAERRFVRWSGHWEQHGFGYWTVHGSPDLPDDHPLGFCGVKLMRLHGRIVLNLFYRLDPRIWGKGVATEAAGAVLRWAVTHLPDRTVIARVRPENTASLKVVTRIGLRRARQLDTIGYDGPELIYTSNGWARTSRRRADPPGSR